MVIKVDNYINQFKIIVHNGFAVTPGSLAVK